MNHSLETPMKAFAVLTLAIAGAVVAIAASAQPAQVQPNDESDGNSPLTTVKVVNGIAYLNGGANINEADYLKRRSSEFPLQFIFSGRGGEYGVADKVTIRSGDLEVVSVADAGPYLMLKVPPGRYAVEASFKGVVESRTVVVGSGVTKVSWNTLRASD
jgi:hypothetical protein